ncbi:hypothetical protein ACGFMM_02360 [Streptomyces sp. NPDC048604]|uniref:hypothetical protein n=1 Tax=Streptomyces sp. NPDC048604 TaxID=3365578 RepID=UPI00371A15F6
MRKIIATFALAAAAVLGGSGTALAHNADVIDGPDVVVVDHTVVVCGDFSTCAGDVG